MQKKVVKYLLAITALVFVAYNSVYFKKLDEVKAASTSKKFDAPGYARNFYHKKLLPSLNKAIELTVLINLVKTDAGKGFKDYSNALGIGNIRYFLVKGKGVITGINENDITITMKGDSSKKEIQIATEFVFGNAIRDASGLIDINEFNSTMDFNNVSAEVNKIIRAEVLPGFKTNAKKGNLIKFSGAIELNQAHLSLDNIEVIPMSLSIVK